MTPLEWRPRHDAFAAAVQQLRRASPQGPQLDAVTSLTQALREHMTYEEETLWPLVASHAPPDGPGSLRAWQRDHRLIRAHLEHASHADPLTRAWSLGRLEGVLEHHDHREASYLLPLLEQQGVMIALHEDPVLHAILAPVSVAVEPHGTTWEEVLRCLACGACPPLPGGAPHAKATRIRARYARAVQQRDRASDLLAKRTACVEAFDCALEAAWCDGQSHAPWVTALRAHSASAR